MKRLIIAFAFVALASCETEDPTMAVVADAYPAVGDAGAAGEVSVYKAWWSTTLVADPVAPGGESPAQRAVPASDYAYALLAPGWDPSSGAPPSRLVAVRSTTKLSVGRGDTLRIAVSPESFDGDCAAGKPLAQDDADFITQRIFPGDFAGVTYDAKTCTTISADGGAPDAGGDGD